MASKKVPREITKNKEFTKRRSVSRVYLSKELQAAISGLNRVPSDLTQIGREGLAHLTFRRIADVAGLPRKQRQQQQQIFSDIWREKELRELEIWADKKCRNIYKKFTFEGWDADLDHPLTTGDRMENAKALSFARLLIKIKQYPLRFKSCQFCATFFWDSTGNAQQSTCGSEKCIRERGRNATAETRKKPQDQRRKFKNILRRK